MSEKEDKGYYFIDDLGKTQFSSELLDEVDGHPNNWMIRKKLGNYFESRGEAELARRKNMAWKQLKDDGITFCLDEFDSKPCIVIGSKEEKGPVQKVMRIIENLTLLFGGEDE